MASASRFGSLAVALVGCAAIGIDAEDPQEPGGDAPSLLVVPHAPALDEPVPELQQHGTADGDAPIDDALDCPLWAATNVDVEHREAVRALCWAPTYDSGAIGYTGHRTASREALECLLDLDVPTQWFVALASAKNPVTRTYAREAIHRRDAWTPELVHSAMLDSVSIPTREGCSSYPMTANELGYAGAAGRDDVRIDLLLLESDLFDQADMLAGRFQRDYGCQRWRDAVHCSGSDCYVYCPSRTRCEVSKWVGTVTCDAPVQCEVRCGADDHAAQDCGDGRLACDGC